MSTSRPRAPSASRSPISRVRSVTETSMMFMIPIPPTTSEMLAIAASSIVITCVVPCAAAAISLWLRTVKSSGSFGASRCEARRIARISSCAAGISSGENVLARIWGMKARPARRVRTVVYGARMTSSWSPPSAVWPLGASTPITWTGTSRTRSCWPTASPFGNRFSATVAPSTTTLRMARTSLSWKKTPSCTGQSRICW